VCYNQFYIKKLYTVASTRITLSSQNWFLKIKNKKTKHNFIELELLLTFEKHF